MRKGLMFFGVVAVMMGQALCANAFEVGIRGNYWFADTSGNIRVDGNGLAGTDLDLKDTMGVDNEYNLVLEVFAGLGNHHLNFSYYNADYQGNNVLTANINFKGLVFNSGDAIRTALKYDVYDITYRYDLLDLENILAGFSLGLVGRIEFMDGSAEINSATQSARQDFSIPIPLLGLNGHFGILADILEARVLVTGISYGGGTVFDAQADLSYTPLPFVDIHGGYRIYTINVDVSDIDLNYTVSGPYLAVTVNF